MTVVGEGCCDGIVFPGSFEMDYELDEPAGSVRITRLYTSLADMDIKFHFLIFETGSVRLRCGTARNESSIEGTTDVLGNLTVPTGAATLSGGAFQQRDDGGECGGSVSTITLNNNAPLSGVLDPASNRLSFNVDFTTSTEGRTYNIRLAMTGDYVNLPPVARPGAKGGGWKPSRRVVVQRS